MCAHLCFLHMLFLFLQAFCFVPKLFLYDMCGSVFECVIHQMVQDIDHRCDLPHVRAPNVVSPSQLLPFHDASALLVFFFLPFLVYVIHSLDLSCGKCLHSIIFFSHISSVLSVPLLVIRRRSHLIGQRSIRK